MCGQVVEYRERFRLYVQISRLDIAKQELTETEDDLNAMIWGLQGRVVIWQTLGRMKSWKYWRQGVYNDIIVDWFTKVSLVNSIGKLCSL
jgi:hypothetical protein